MDRSDQHCDLLRKYARKSVRRSSVDAVPLFFVIAGSHLYGTADSSSDIDVRGVHVVDAAEYTKLDTPPERIRKSSTVNGISANVDFESYELRTFGRNLATSDFTGVELLFASRYLLNREPELTDQLVDLVVGHLPLELPTRYRGLALSMSEQITSRQETNQTSFVKQYLYALRGILAAEYVQQYNNIEPNLTVLASRLLATPQQEIIQKLVAHKRTPETEPLPKALRTDVQALLESRLQSFSAHQFADAERVQWKRELNEWMAETRKTV